MNDALTKCTLGKNSEIKEDVYAISINDWDMSKEYDEIRSKSLDDYIKAGTTKWSDINTNYTKAVEIIDEGPLKENVKQAYSMKYFGTSKNGDSRIPEHCIESLQFLLMKFTTPKMGLINLAVKEDIPEKGNINIRNIISSGEKHKRLNYRIIMSKQPYYIAKLAEYCMTLSCHPLLVANTRLEGTKVFDPIPIDTLYEIGGDLINYAIKKCGKKEFSPWYAYGVKTNGGIPALSYNGISQFEHNVRTIPFYLNDPGDILKVQEDLKNHKKPTSVDFLNPTFDRFLKNYENAQLERTQLEKGTQTDVLD
uniref:Uncharacterized protein n=1 Tax=Panagrolaimus davidi TaxID=227884 RepID=A0A914R484_9BILA